ncbi:MAG: hypothetical protein EOP06_09475 [Proteobacteria bacterium]|nr:MAG: hypothetical protein EOP06_09475 [Pseudomonadota bacterium]
MIDLSKAAEEAPISQGEQALCWKKIENLAGDLTSRMRIVFSTTETPVGCQDGTKFGSIGVYCRFPKNERGLIGFSVLEVEFSRYAKLFTLRSPVTGWALFSSDEIENIIGVIGRAGFIFVCESELDCEYKGADSAFLGKTWRERFFASAV